MKLFSSFAGLDAGSRELVLIQNELGNDGELTQTVYSKKKEIISQNGWEIKSVEIEELKNFILKEKLLKKEIS